MKRSVRILIWFAICFSLGAAGKYFVGLNFWLSSLIAGLALIANGLIAEWEDRGKF